MELLLQQIQKCFEIPNKSFINGYTYIYQFMVARGGESKAETIINLFTKEIYLKAKRYNNIYIVDKETYDKEANQVLRMCEIIQRYHLRLHNIPDHLDNIIKNAWENAERIKQLSMIGCISIQYNLPAGDPCWVSKMIGEYV
jgi:hypothetical protein